MSGTLASRTSCGRASAAAWSLTVTRTYSAPAEASSRIWSSVACTSPVRVVVMLCTRTGAPPPMGRLPTMICRVGRRGAQTGRGAARRGSRAWGSFMRHRP